MATTTGTALDYRDLLLKLRTFLTTTMLPAPERWTELRWTSAAEDELVLQGPGLAALDQVIFGIQTVAGADYGNWRLRGFSGFNPALPFAGQYLSSSDTYVPLGISTMTYWIVANGRRVVVVVKVGTAYMFMYAGLVLPYTTPNQYPYPMLISGCGDSALRFSDVSLTHGIRNASTPYSTKLFMPISEWSGTNPNYLYMWPAYWGGEMTTCPDGVMPIHPIVLNGMAELDGCFMVPGTGNTAENTITIGGISYLVVPNVYRSGVNDYWALRLE